MKKLIAGYAQSHPSQFPQGRPFIQQALVYAMSRDYDITDGAEFIDDGMRMKEQPLHRPMAYGAPGIKPAASLSNAAGQREVRRMPSGSTAGNSVQQVIRTLQKEGYTENFATDTDALYGGEMDIRYHPDDFRIDMTFRFAENCGPNGNPIIYAITSKTGVKGTLTDMTGTCSLKHHRVEKNYIVEPT